ncbi:hypothetical protein VNO78_14873 [Psophocarpus tetragonolobus]|uniref:Uncharacterized protein n=1 Tax=Psophocarpus tetragonolobus TaxID=3891 RepID=A0AAN9XJ41_PSOTE
MKITVLSTLLLGCLLVLTVPGDSSARVVPGEVGNKNKFVVFAQKEPVVRAGDGQMRKIGLGGRKFSTEMTSMDSKNGKEADGETSKISGATYSDGICKDNDGGLKKSSGSRDQNNEAQKLMTKALSQYLKYTKFVIPRRIPSSRCLQDCDVVAVKSNLGSSPSHEQKISQEARDDETQRFADAAREIANMMNKDYHGKPSHRPPINNHEPTN